MKTAADHVRRALLLLTLAAAGCGSMPGVDDVLPDRKVEYKKSLEVEKNLEIPPDLSKSSISDELVIPAGASRGATMSTFETRRRNAGSIAIFRYLFLTLALATTIWACGDARGDVKGPKIVILGIDGMDWGLTQELMERGEMPNFSRLAAEGSA